MTESIVCRTEHSNFIPSIEHKVFWYSKTHKASIMRPTEHDNNMIRGRLQIIIVHLCTVNRIHYENSYFNLFYEVYFV